MKKDHVTYNFKEIKFRVDLFWRIDESDNFHGFAKKKTWNPSKVIHAKTNLTKTNLREN